MLDPMKNTCENMALITEISCCLQYYKYVGEFSINLYYTACNTNEVQTPNPQLF